MLLKMPTASMKECFSKSMEIKLLGQYSEYTSTIAQWLFDEFSHLEQAPISVETLEKRLSARTNLKKCPLTCICFHDGLPVGTASLVDDDGLKICSHLSPWLADVYVVPSYRRQGVGEALTRHVTTLAKLNGYKKCYLYTENQQAFFASLGWTQQMHTPAFHNKVPVTVMEWLL